MENLVPTYSAVFLIVCTVSMLFGIYSLTVNPKERINRLFFFICLCMGVWSLGFSAALSAPTRESCLFWRRVSGIGWGILPGALLHFILMLTGETRILKKKGIYLPLYLPAALYIWAFSISGRLTVGQYQLVGTQSGWNFFFDGCYVSFSLVGLALLWRRRKNCVNGKERRQTGILLTAFAGGAALSAVLEAAGSSLRILSISQIAPVFFLIPIATLFYRIQKYSFSHKTFMDDTEIILDSSNRPKVYDSLSAAFFSGGLLLLISQSLPPQSGKSAAPFWAAALLFALGVVIQVFQKCKAGHKIMGVLYAASIMLVIPVVTFSFIDTAAVTVWAFPFILVILSMVFNKRFVLAATAVSIVFTQALVWIIRPQTAVIMEGSDYIGRIGIFSVAILAAFYVNQVYILRLRENAEQIRVQTLLFEVSTLLVTIDRSNKEDKLNTMLQKIRMFFQADQCCLCLTDPEYALLLRCAEPGYREECADKADMRCGKIRRIEQDTSVQMPDTQILPEEAGKIRRRLETENIRAAVMVKGSTIGFLNVQSEKPAKKWHADHTSLIKIVANIVADALVKVNAEEKINFMAHYDQLTGLPNRMLFADRAKKAIELAGQTGKMLGMIFLDLDCFKNINDTLGHETGDLLIQDVARRLSRCTRDSDTVSRFGGDEYLILLDPVCRGEDVVRTADVMMRQLRVPFLFKEQEYSITASAGIALYPADGETIDTLIKNADAAMYRAKEKGKNRYVFYADMKHW